MKTFIILVLVAACGYLLWDKQVRETHSLFGSEKTESTEGPHATPDQRTLVAPAKGKSRASAFEELRVIHGTITGRSSAVGIEVRCDPHYYAGLENYRAPADAGAGENMRVAALAAAQDTRAYGPLMTHEGGHWHTAANRPRIEATGVVQLQGELPAGAFTSAGRVNVVAAPLGDNLFTTSFQLPSGTWMWLRNKESIDH
jgi:hypothetical protein